MAAAVARCGSVNGSAARLWTLMSAAVVVITAAALAAGCSTAACTACNAGPAAAESMPLAAPLTNACHFLVPLTAIGYIIPME